MHDALEFHAIARLSVFGTGPLTQIVDKLIFLYNRELGNAVPTGTNIRGRRLGRCIGATGNAAILL